MTTTLRRRSTLLLSAVVALGVMAAVPVQGASSDARPAPLLRAVVTLDGVRAATAPGVRVLATFPHVGAELVAATRDGLNRLAREAGVVGISSDLKMTVAGKSYGAGASVLAPEAVGGEAGTTGAGRGVNVALLDTGVTDTAALNRAGGRITDGVDVSQLGDPGGVVRTSGEFTDGYGHGTFLASLIAGGKVAGSGERAIGVAPAARIVVAKVADDQGNTSLGKVLAGFDWVAAHARGPAGQQMINVLNVALSVVKPGPSYGRDPLTEAVEHVRAAGVVVVAAAGNDAGGVGDPGMDPQALTVGAADVSDGASVASFSGRGVVAGVTKPDLVAPGVHVLGVMPTTALVYQQHPAGIQANGLFRGSGTSEATAVTSGAAAVFLSRHPDATPPQVKASLRKAARPLNAAGAGAGLLRVATNVVNAGSDAGSGGTDWTGEAGFDASSWSASSWSGAGDWTSLLASSWSASSWSASSWSASSWSASSWSASSWSASSWSASSWSASSWSGSAWAASSWSASSWSASSWSASSWSASSWSASSWSAASWGEDA